MNAKPLRSRINFSLRFLLVAVLFAAAYCAGRVHGRGDHARNLTRETLRLQRERQRLTKDIAVWQAQVQTTEQRFEERRLELRHANSN